MNSFVILFLCIASIISRVSIDSTNGEDLVFLMAVINTVALIIVAINLYEKTFNILDTKINKMSNSAFAFSMKEHIKKKKNICASITVLLCMFYIGFWKNSLMNDLISIISLTLSIIDDDISRFLADKIFNKK